MAQREENMSGGLLFRETAKRTEKSPDYRRRITVAGVTYWLSGWVREGKDGRKYLSLAVSEQADGPRRTREDEPIPF